MKKQDKKIVIVNKTKRVLRFDSKNNMIWRYFLKPNEAVESFVDDVFVVSEGGRKVAEKEKRDKVVEKAFKKYKLRR